MAIPSAAQAILLSRKSVFYLELLNLERSLWEQVNQSRTTLDYAAVQIGDPRGPNGYPIQINLLTALQADFYACLVQVGYTVMKSQHGHWFITWTNPFLGIPTGQSTDQIDTAATIKTVNASIDAGQFFAMDTRTGPLTLTLVDSPAQFSLLRFEDPYGSWASNPVTVLPQGGNLINSDPLLILDQPARIELLFDAGNWRIKTHDDLFKFENLA